MQNITCQFVNSITHINQNDWLTNSHNPTISYEFLQALEQTNCATHHTGWQPSHLILKQAQKIQAQKIIAIVPIYEKHHAYGEYIFDYNLQEAYARLGIAYFPKLLSAVPFTPVSGNRILTNDNNPDIIPTIVKFLQTHSEQNNYSGFHFNFISEPQAEQLKNNGMLIRKTHQYHWFNRDYKNFDDFLSSLSSRKRKNIKKERKYIADLGISHKHITGDDLTHEAMDIFYEFYCLTYDKKWGSPYLNRDFFYTIADTMADNILLIIGEQNGRAISGALNFIGKDCLIGRNWGCNTSIDFLHFETCYYQALDFACKHGLKWVEAGTQGEHKLQRGYEPVLTYSAHYLVNRELHKAYGDFLLHDADSMDDLMTYLQNYTPYRKTLPPSSPSPPSPTLKST